LKLKDVPVQYNDNLLIVLRRGEWKYIDTQTRRKLIQKKKIVGESNNKTSDMSPNFMQNRFDKKFNFRVNEIIWPTPAGSSRAKRTVELVPVLKDKPDPELIDKLEQVRGHELNAFKRNNSQLLGGRELYKNLIKVGR